MRHCLSVRPGARPSLARVTRIEHAPAGPDEIGQYLAMRDAAAEAMVAAGIVQWQPGELTAGRLRDWLGDGQLLLARLDGELVGGVMVMWADPMFWGERDDDAGYVHGLLVGRGRAGGRYYRDAGYAEVGEKVFERGSVLDGGAPIGSVTLFEKRLAPE